MNPLLIDPTRTSWLRKRFSAELNRRLDRFKKALWNLVVIEDAFGFGERSRNPFISNTRWRFQTSDQQLRSFLTWLQIRLATEILGEGVNVTIPANETWLASYIQEAYSGGMARAFDSLRRIPVDDTALDFYRGTKAEFLQSAFGRPVSVGRVKLLASRTFTSLQGVTESMAQGIGRELVDGMILGLSPRDVARQMSKVVENIGRKRALVIARTETIRAHNEGAIDALEVLGAKEVGVMVEWSTAKDSRVCPLCKPLQGVVLKIEEARGRLPRHPNCRCAIIPANVGEDRSKQIRGKRKIEAAIRASIKAERPKKSYEENLKRTRWAGADGEIDKSRPASMV